MQKFISFLLAFVLSGNIYAQNIPNGVTAPPAVMAPRIPDYLFAGDTPRNYVRTYTPLKIITDSSQINLTSIPEDVSISTLFIDAYGRVQQKVDKAFSPTKKDNVLPVLYDEFQRLPVNYLPFAAASGDGNFKFNAFSLDSAFYKFHFPNEQIIFSQTIYDRSPLNITVKSLAQGNSWGGNNVGSTMARRSNSTFDSVVLWSIPINNFDDLPVNSGFYLPGTLIVNELIDEHGIRRIEYVNDLGQIILSKVQFSNVPSTGHNGWYCTYSIFDETGRVRIVIPPKAVEALHSPSVNWAISSNLAIKSGLCYSYFYDVKGRIIYKFIPGKGKTYIAYDLFDRPVMSQDENLRLTNQWNFVVYDIQGRPKQTGVISSNLLKDSIITQAARSLNYPILSGVYSITNENYYDDYSWITGTGASLTSLLDGVNINSNNFNLNYNSFPDYPQAISSSIRIKGAVTGTRKLVINTNTYLYSVFIYGDKGQVIQAKTTNNTGGTDITTNQFGFYGRKLSVHFSHQKNGVNSQTHSLVTKFGYDHTGRTVKIYKNIDGQGDKLITQTSFNELGQVQTKLISPNGGNAGSPLETQNYKYNIRGWLIGINDNYVNASGNGSNFFGESIHYNTGFTNIQLNGNISGIKWKSAGDGVARAYGFGYDNASRLINADYSQLNNAATNWTKDQVDFTNDFLTYDPNGNILTMRQKGLKVGRSVTIDSLTYSYSPNSNQVIKVSDGISDNSNLGDFKDTTLTTDDYTYDANGNIIKDNNRHMHSTTNGQGAYYNYLDKIDSIKISGKLAAHYTYDGSGTLIAKQITKYESTGIKSSKYVYINGFVYLNDTLQYVMFEEGKIRYAKKYLSTNPAVSYFKFEFDYYLKDHIGNVRSVITEGKDTATYIATNEPSNQNKEDALFSNIYSPNNTTVLKPNGFDAETGNTKVVRLNGNTANQKVGAGITLKVMAGDKVQMSTFSFFNSVTQPPVNGVNLLSDILGVLSNGVINNSAGKLTSSNGSVLNTVISPNITKFLDSCRIYDNSKPKAYLNWILLDEQFSIVTGSSGVIQVVSGASKQALVSSLLNMSKNGYLYVYLSNESSQDVFFDDLTIRHFSGPLQQEQSFYPFGVQMSAISSKAMLKTSDPYKYNSGSELEDDLNYYNTFYRKYDPQIGRFTSVDSKSESTYGYSNYHYASNSPVMFNDPLGDISSSEFGTILDKLMSSDLGGTWSSSCPDVIAYFGDQLVADFFSGFAAMGNSLAVTGGGGSGEYGITSGMGNIDNRLNSLFTQFANIGKGIGNLKYVKSGGDRYIENDLAKIASNTTGRLVLALLEVNKININISLTANKGFNVNADLFGEAGLSHSSNYNKITNSISILYYPGIGDAIPTFKDGVAFHSYTTLAHELWHALDRGCRAINQPNNLWYIDSSDPLFTNQDLSFKMTGQNVDPNRGYREIRAVVFENVIRAAFNLPLRTRYTIDIEPLMKQIKFKSDLGSSLNSLRSAP